MAEPYRVMLIAWVLVGVWIAFVIYTNRKVHPKALFFLFMVELWERFSYYGMRALLVLYLTSETIKGGFGLEEKLAVAIYAAYGALVYLTPLAGGYLADRLLGFRKSIIWGALLMAAGQFTLASSTGNKYLLYAGLALLVIGNGFFKPNISSLIGKFYPAGDPRRDGAFTIFYMGINIGAFLTPLTCGTIGELEGWSYGFLCAGIGMLVGLGTFLYTVSIGVLGHHADPPSAPPVSMAAREPGDVAEAPTGPPHPGAPPAGSPLFVYVGTLLMIPVAGLLIYQNDVMDYLLGAVGLGAIGYMLYLSFQYPKEERQRMWVIIVLLFFTAVFWTFFELAGSALTLFTKRNVDRNFLGVELTTSNFQAVNAFFIMLFAPVFSVMWVQLAKKGWEPNAAVKFAIGLLLLGGGFLILNLGKAAATAAMVPALFLILLYLLHTLGELALSPVGLSLVTKLAPAKIVGFMMGFWFLSSAIAHQAGKWIAGEAAADKDATPEQTLDLALSVFNQVGLFAIGSGVLLLVLSPVLKKWMHGVK
ncbi:MAG: peptide MFS transporter [Planctomycetes bacterium]|nr:peptide MFS transporter [Planctomycetota bacterium]